MAMMMATPQSLDKQGGFDVVMMLPLGQVGGFLMMTTTELGNQGGKFDTIKPGEFEAMTNALGK